MSESTDYGLDLGQLEDLARDYCGTDELEIDPLKPGDISPGEDGIWVRVWVHLPNDYLEEHGIQNPEGPLIEDKDEEEDELP